jgi:hypothetical protein
MAYPDFLRFCIDRPQINVAIQMIIVTFVKRLLSYNHFDLSFFKDVLFTVLAFMVSSLVSYRLKNVNEKIDSTVGKKVSGDIIGPIVMFLSKAFFINTLSADTQQIDVKFLINMFSVVAGFACYNIFFNDAVDALDIDGEVIDIIRAIFKPFTMLMFSNFVKDPVDAFTYDNMRNSIRQALFAINGFVTFHIVEKTFLK